MHRFIDTQGLIGKTGQLFAVGRTWHIERLCRKYPDLDPQWVNATFGQSEVEYMQRVANAIIEGRGLRKPLSWDNLGMARVRLFKDHKFRSDGIPRFWFEFYPSHTLPPPKAGKTRFRSRDLRCFYEYARETMNGDPNPGLTIRRLYNKIEDDARKMLLERVSSNHS
jgi:hypothetical protein